MELNENLEVRNGMIYHRGIRFLETKKILKNVLIEQGIEMLN